MGGLLHLVQRGGDWAGCGPAHSPPRCTKCNSPPIDGQCTNFVLFDVALQVPLPIKAWVNIVAVIATKSTITQETQDVQRIFGRQQLAYSLIVHIR